MNPEITKLIEIAKSGEYVSEKQKEIILNKAKLLGEDVDEVEMILETFLNHTTVNPIPQSTKKKKCPNCGKIVDDLSLFCPDCGYAFNTESDANHRIREAINACSKAIKDASSNKRSIVKELREMGEKDVTSDDYRVYEAILDKKLAAVRELDVPYTINAMIQAFEYVYGLYESSNLGENGNSYDHEFCTACLGKAKEIYFLIKGQENNDPKIAAWIKAHSFIEKEKKKGDGIGGMCLIETILFIAVGVGLFFLVRSCV